MCYAVSNLFTGTILVETVFHTLDVDAVNDQYISGDGLVQNCIKVLVLFSCYNCFTIYQSDRLSKGIPKN